jgi:hypothetical protein
MGISGILVEGCMNKLGVALQQGSQKEHGERGHAYVLSYSNSCSRSPAGVLLSCPAVRCDS